MRGYYQLSIHFISYIFFLLIQRAEIFDCYFICLFRLYMIWWMNSTWALCWWPVFIYRPKNMSKHGWCSILTSSLVQVEAKTRYMFIDIALVFLVLWRLFSTVNLWQWPRCWCCLFISIWSYFVKPQAAYNIFAQSAKPNMHCHSDWSFSLI